MSELVDGVGRGGLTTEDTSGQDVAMEGTILTTTQYAKCIGKSRQTVLNWLAAGVQLPGVVRTFKTKGGFNRLVMETRC